MVLQKRTIDEKFSIESRGDCLNIKLLNVQGLTKSKAGELERLMVENSGDINVMCIVETQQKFKKVDFSEAFATVDKMRSMGDKKGGGLTFLCDVCTDLLVEELQYENPDVMKVNLKY